MKKVRICAVVTGKTIGEFLKNLEKIQRVADLVELRVDYIDGFSTSDIDLIKSKTKKQAIFTCRKKEEGGFFTGGEKKRFEILEKAMGAGFDFVDIELSSAKSLFKKSKKLSSRPKRKRSGEISSHEVALWYEIPRLPSVARNDKKDAFQTGQKIILSFHDFTKTPALAELEGIKKQMKKYPADIMKFATFVRDDVDSKVLFQFLLNKSDNEEMIVVGMGERGKMVRIVGPLLGSYLTYASTDFLQSAIGQMRIEELRKIYNDMGIVKCQCREG